MTDELKKCPFCGKEHPIYEAAPIIGYREDDGEGIIGEWRVLVSLQDHEDELTPEVWNTRPLEDALQQRITTLEAQLRWIPVSEGLPVSNNLYEVKRGPKDNWVYTYAFYWEDGKWTQYESIGFYDDILEWRVIPELPNPPEEKA